MFVEHCSFKDHWTLAELVVTDKEDMGRKHPKNKADGKYQAVMPAFSTDLQPIDFIISGLLRGAIDHALEVCGRKEYNPAERVGNFVTSLRRSCNYSTLGFNRESNPELASLADEVLKILTLSLIHI